MIPEGVDLLMDAVQGSSGRRMDGFFQLLVKRATQVLGLPLHQHRLLLARQVTAPPPSTGDQGHHPLDARQHRAHGSQVPCPRSTASPPLLVSSLLRETRLPSQLL